MEIYQIISVLIFLTMVFAYVNAKLIKWPSTIGIMVLSLITSVLLLIFSKQVPWLSAKATQLIRAIDFEIVLMQIMLSFLLFAGAIHIDYKKLKKQLLPIMIMAIIGTLISTFLVGTMAYYLLNLFQLGAPFIHCLLFGALISPTDPIAVLGILKKRAFPSPWSLKLRENPYLMMASLS